MLKVGVFGVGHLGKFHLNNWKDIKTWSWWVSTIRTTYLLRKSQKNISCRGSWPRAPPGSCWYRRYCGAHYLPFRALQIGDPQGKTCFCGKAIGEYDGRSPRARETGSRIQHKAAGRSCRTVQPRLPGHSAPSVESHVYRGASPAPNSTRGVQR